MTATLNIPLGQIAAVIDGTLEGDEGTMIVGPGALDSAQSGQIVFVDRPDLVGVGEESDASALIVPPNTTSTRKPIIVTEDPRLAFSKVLELFNPKPRVEPGVHPTAVLGSNVHIGEGASVGAHAVIGDNVIIKDRAIVHPLAYVGHEATIGEDSQLHPHSYVGERVTVGDRTVIHGGAVIGCDGFGFLQTAHGHKKIPQVGSVIIGDDVEIGACSTVDRATVAATRIGNGTKIDDQVHVAHNCEIGENCLLCGQVGIAGSTKVGNNVVMGGQAGVNDHVSIGDNVIVAARASVFGDLTEPGVYSGYPARPHQGQLRVSASGQKLPDLFRHIRTLEKRIVELEKRLADSEDGA